MLCTKKQKSEGYDSWLVTLDIGSHGPRLGSLCEDIDMLCTKTKKVKGMITG